MNGIHDMGGMAGFGPIRRESNESVFREDWERRVFAMTLATVGLFGPVDRIRHATARMDPARYLGTSYYEHWLASLETLAREFGVLSDAEIASVVVTTAKTINSPPPSADLMESIIRVGAPATRDYGRQTPRYRVGDRVRARNIHPRGHTRLPRYVRGHTGVIERFQGVHVFPDTVAHDQGENPQPLYNVRFAASELWGPDASREDHLFIDLWEDYLEPA